MEGVCEDGGAVLDVCVRWGFYEVMTAPVGFRGEKGEEYRADVDPSKRAYWRPRLHNRTYTHVKVYGGVNVPTQSAPWTVFKFEYIHHRLVVTGHFTCGPYSNNQSLTFHCDEMWAIGLGVVCARQRTTANCLTAVPARSQACEQLEDLAQLPAADGGAKEPAKPAAKAPTKQSPAPVTALPPAPPMDAKALGKQVASQLQPVLAKLQPLSAAAVTSAVSAGVKAGMPKQISESQQKALITAGVSSGLASNKVLVKAVSAAATAAVEAASGERLDKMKEIIDSIKESVEDLRPGVPSEPAHTLPPITHGRPRTNHPSPTGGATHTHTHAHARDNTHDNARANSHGHARDATHMHMHSKKLEVYRLHAQHLQTVAAIEACKDEEIRFVKRKRDEAEADLLAAKTKATKIKLELESKIANMSALYEY